MIDISVDLTVNDMDEYNRVLEFAKPGEEAEEDFEGYRMWDFIKSHPKEEQCALMCKYSSRLGADFYTNPETLSFSWSGADGHSFASTIAEEVAEHFTDIIFRICRQCIATGDYDFGVVENGVIKRLEMSKEVHETINEMIYFDIDVDPYAGPTPENYHQLHLCRWDYTMHDINNDGEFLGTASLQVKDMEEFRRVLEYVKPDESETAPQDREEYGQVTDFVATLSGTERCAWMTKHCKRLNVEFEVDTAKQTLSWSGYCAMKDWAKEILNLVVAQFPEIEFRVSVIDIPHGSYSIDFGISERGKIKWLDLSYEVRDMYSMGIDVDPYAGPTPENLRQYKVRRWNIEIESNRERRRPHFVSLQVENHDEYLRVLEFVTPDESDQNPRDGEECEQVDDYLDTLSGTERCAWMTRHCARLFMSLNKNEEKHQLLWSNSGAFGSMVYDIARLVVAQFPDIKFRICVNHYKTSFGHSENGDIKWLELSWEEEQRMWDEVCDSIFEDDTDDLPF